MLDFMVGEAQRHRGLTVFPLITPVPIELPYLLLADALEEGSVGITEVGEGSVPQLLARNGSPRDVLILDGEQLVGARQNRMTNRSLLLPAGMETTIPVYCMEQGRWRFQGREFAPAKQGAPASVRRHARELEAVLVRAGAGAPHESLAGAQGLVWDAIAEAEAVHGGQSPTRALNELYDTLAADLEVPAGRLPAVEGQVGVLCFAGKAVLGLDLVGGGALWARVHERLLKGYVLDALAHTHLPASPVDETAAWSFVDEVRRAERVLSPTAGNGRYSVLRGEVVGGELADSPGLAHLCAFPRRPPEDDGRRRAPEEAPPLARPSRRRYRE